MFGLILVPIYARHLRTDRFGVLSILILTLTLITILFKLGLNHAFFRHYYETADPVRRARIVGTTLLTLLGSSVALVAMLYTLAPDVSSLIFSGGPSQHEALRLVLLIAFFDIIGVVPDSLLRASFRSVRYTVLNVAALAVQLVLIWYLVIYVGATVENVLTGRLIGTALGTALLFAAARRDLSLRFSWDELVHMLGFGLPLVAGQLAMTLFMMVDRFFLERYASHREVGVYTMSYTLVSAVSVLLTAPFGQVWTVMRFKVMKEEGAVEYYSRILTYIVLASMFLALGVTAIGGDGLLLFGLRGYWNSALIIPLLAMSAVLDGAARVLNIGLTLRRRTVFAPLVVIAALLVNLALNFALIPTYGSRGAAIATVLSYLFFCALRYHVSNLFFRVEYEWGRILKLFAAGSALIVIYYLLTGLYFDPFVSGDESLRPMIYMMMSVKLGLLLLFPVLLWAMRFYNEGEIARVRAGFNRLAISASENGGWVKGGLELFRRLAAGDSNQGQEAASEVPDRNTQANTLLERTSD